MIPYGRQNISKEDIQAVVEVLKSDFLTCGPKIPEFEKQICDYTGAKYCVAVTNGTAALHIAIASLNIEEGMEGITSPNTFVATSNAMIYNGLIPVFADIEMQTYCIDYNEIKNKISSKTGLIIPVHFAGHPCDMKEISRIAGEKIRIIEDAAHAIGSNYSDGTKVGNCNYSDMTIFSFHPVKTVTTGEGGAITTNDKKLYQRLLNLRNHGITKEQSDLSRTLGPWYYEVHSLGFNYRITDIQAALGISQLKKLDSFKSKRRAIAQRYTKAFSDIEWIITPYEKPFVDSCFHLYVIQIDFSQIGKSKSELMNTLKQKGIGTQVHYIPVHTQPYYMKNYNFMKGDYKKAEYYYDRALSLPLYPKMKNSDVEYVIQQVLDLVKE